ncbi:hypothetical protein GEV43_27265 [Actinomadura sp. J1-007]|uniref:YcaO-like family protein n=1 Tax=Actinomadura sp. J1-007 TaxID=2661913 RepID=UPI0013220D9C|nr:YcaO-like family protein [Actinomadura sp. J1-007]MWK37399.1 hypothetical protein [Actinomadura sp. J1-007]
MGALFEALEHHFSGPACFDPARVTMRSGEDLAAGPLAAEACAPALAAAGTVACHDYTPIHAVLPPGSGPGSGAPVHGPNGSPSEDGAQETAGSLAVPLVLAGTWYFDRPELRQMAGDGTDYRALARYSWNSGSAIGVNRAEALVHALNETIERDAVSLLLARLFVHRDTRWLRVIDPETLPAQLAAAHHALRALSGSPVHLVEVTTDIGVPAFIAYTHNAACTEGRIGAGASLSPAYAAWRALAELAQRQLGERAFPGPRVTPSMQGLERYPALRAAARLDLRDHLTRAPRVPFRDEDPGDRPSRTLPEQLRELTGLLTAAGHRPYHRVSAILPGGITVVHAFVPGLERFWLVTDGMLVIPGPRAKTLASASGAVPTRSAYRGEQA